MTISHVFAGLPVTDFESALEWYERLLGRGPDQFPHADEAVWQLTDSGLVYVVTDPPRAGSALLTLIVTDLDAWGPEIASRGLGVGETETLAGGVRKLSLADPDGNAVVLGEVPGSG